MPLLSLARMFYMKRTYEEINEKIKVGKVQVITAFEAKSLIKERGIKDFLKNVDIVTCATYEMNVNALLYLSFGQTDPLIYFSEAHINNVYAYPVGPTDLVLSCVNSSKENPEYSGATVLEELVKGKDVELKASGKNLEVFTNKEFETWFNIGDLNVGRLILSQAINQNSIVATNSGKHDINSNMGTLIGGLENSTYNSASFLNPLINDPFCKVVGVGTKVWVSGAQGYVTGYGSNHNSGQKRNNFGIPIGPGITLSVISDINKMNPKWLRSGYLKSYGPVLFVGIGVAIPVLNEEVAEYLAITDEKINTTIVDFSIPRRTKPTFGQCTYSELRTSTVMINNKPTLSASLSSMAGAIEISGKLKEAVLDRSFYLSEPVATIDLNRDMHKLDARLGELV